MCFRPHPNNIELSLMNADTYIVLNLFFLYSQCYTKHEFSSPPFSLHYKKNIFVTSVILK